MMKEKAIVVCRFLWYFRVCREGALLLCVVLFCCVCVCVCVLVLLCDFLSACPRGIQQGKKGTRECSFRGFSLFPKTRGIFCCCRSVHFGASAPPSPRGQPRKQDCKRNARSSCLAVVVMKVAVSDKPFKQTGECSSMGVIW